MSVVRVDPYQSSWFITVRSKRQRFIPRSRISSIFPASLLVWILSYGTSTCYWY